jgi:hypothetical protein
MEALNIVKEVLTDKLIACLELPIHSGPKGYDIILRMRLLLYGHLKGYLSTRKLRKHLKKHPEVLRQLGFKTLPNRRTIDRWKKKLAEFMPKLIHRTGNSYLQQRGSEWTILDSTPLEDEKDPDAKTGYTSKGKFKGFKLHMSCDESEVPLRAEFTTGNVHDSVKAEELLAPTPRTGGDSGYNAKRIKMAAKTKESKIVTAHNPRREGKDKKKKSPRILRKIRFIVEQCNSLIKNEVMLNAWKKVKGFAVKAFFALMAVFAMQAMALWNLKHYGYPSVRINDVRV